MVHTYSLESTRNFRALKNTFYDEIGFCPGVMVTYGRFFRRNRKGQTKHEHHHSSSFLIEEIEKTSRTCSCSCKP